MVKSNRCFSVFAPINFVVFLVGPVYLETHLIFLLGLSLRFYAEIYNNYNHDPLMCCRHVWGREAGWEGGVWARPQHWHLGTNQRTGEWVVYGLIHNIDTWEPIDLSTARSPVLVFMIYASLPWILIIIWEPYRSIIILLTNYRTRWLW